MKSSWGVVVGLCALIGCGPEDHATEARELLESQPPSEKPVRITVEPGAVTFPRGFVGQPTTAAVRLSNTGEAQVLVELRIPEPFTVGSTELNLAPSGEHTVELRLMPTEPGSVGAVLTVKAGTRRMELPVRAEVEPSPVSP